MNCQTFSQNPRTLGKSHHHHFLQSNFHSNEYARYEVYFILLSSDEFALWSVPYSAEPLPKLWKLPLGPDSGQRRYRFWNCRILTWHLATTRELGITTPPLENMRYDLAVAVDGQSMKRCCSSHFRRNPIWWISAWLIQACFHSLQAL